MSYVEGFVVPVPAGNKEQYRKMVDLAIGLYREYGALRVVECWGDDVPEGKVTDFRRAVDAKEGEVVVFSWIVWPSKQVRDDGNRKLMQDPRMQDQPMPFDGRRMIMGGFQPLFDSADELTRPT